MGVGEDRREDETQPYASLDNRREQRFPNERLEDDGFRNERDFDRKRERSPSPTPNRLAPSQSLRQSGSRSRSRSLTPPRDRYRRSLSPELRGRRGVDYYGDGLGNSTSNGYTSKRARQTCYRCNGVDHIAVLCSSARDAMDDPNASTCDTCGGRGHLSDNCPSTTSADVCYLCRTPGHFARECPRQSSRNHYSSYGHSSYPSYPPPPGPGYPPHGGYHWDSRGPYSGSYPAPPPYGQENWNGSEHPPYHHGGSSSQASAPVANQESEGREDQNGYDYRNGDDKQGEAYDTRRYDSRDGGYYGRGVVSAYGNDGRGGYGMGLYRGGYGGYGGGGYSGGYGGRNVVPGTGRCFRCQQEGHWTRDCPEKPQNVDPNACFKCSKVGHRARDCNACYVCAEEGHRASHCPNRK